MNRKKRCYDLFACLEKGINRIMHSFVTRRVVTKKMPSRILISRLDSIGDFVLFTSALRCYRSLFPSAEIVLLVKREVANIAEKCPYVDSVWILDQRQFRRNPVNKYRWYKRISSYGFDLAINAVYSTSFLFLDCLPAWSGAARRVAFAGPSHKSARERRSLFTEIVPNTNSGMFEIDRNFEMLRHMGYDGATHYRTEVWLTDNDNNNASLVLEKISGLIAILVPGAAARYRCWSPENFSEVAVRASRTRPVTWLICGGPADADVCLETQQRIAASGVPVVNLCSELTLRQMAALIGKATLCLSTETGTAHIAAAMGTLTYCVMGGGHYGRFFPYPDNQKTVPLYCRLPCFNCDWNCPTENYACITKVSVDEVTIAIERACDGNA